ncbi:MAG: DUF177 domain-containing protein [Candidatus Omnitrophica bacterium]|nr:DUF177 domain-containing protein [Candidatus Omnitrophota bacterium]
MKVAVEKISSEPLRLEQEIAPGLWDVDSYDIVFADPIHIAADFLMKPGQIQVEARITTQRLITCSRCLEKTKQGIDYKFIKTYNLDSLGEYLDIDQDLREEILINFPMKVLCKPDCKGLCPDCGVNLNIKKCNC